MCDIVIAADDSVMFDPHYELGIVPGDGIHSCFIELMGIRRAAYAMLMNEKITAQKALEYGMINEVVPKDQLIDRAYEIADVIMAQHRTIRRLTAQVIRRVMNAKRVRDLPVRPLRCLLDQFADELPLLFLSEMPAGYVELYCLGTYLLLVILLGTGLRASETIALTWDDVDMTSREINFQRGIQRDVECEGLKGFVFTAPGCWKLPFRLSQPLIFWGTQTAELPSPCTTISLTLSRSVMRLSR